MSAGAGPVNPVDEFENNFQACLAALTNPDYYNVRDSEEVKTGVEQTIQKFLDAAKNMECFFLQKRLLLSVQKPDHIILENINELKSELARKEQLLNKYYEKIPNWQNQLQDVPGGVARPPPSTVATPPHQMVGAMMPGTSMPNVGIPPLPPTVAGPQGHPHLVTLPHSIPQPPPPMPSTATPSGGMMLPNPQMSHPQSHMVQAQQQGGLQGPLAYLERTMSNIGIPDGTR